MSSPGIKQHSITIEFDTHWLTQNEIVAGDKRITARVATEPKKKWLWLEIITLGFYKSPWYYSVEIIEK